MLVGILVIVCMTVNFVMISEKCIDIGLSVFK